MHKQPIKVFDTLEAFLTAITHSVKGRNHPNYHPCCRVWTNRKQTALRLSHASCMSWGQVLKEAGCSETEPEVLLRAHMQEHGWGLPIRVDVRCKVFRHPPSPTQAQAAFTLHQPVPTLEPTPPEPSADCSPNQKLVSIHSEPLPPADPQPNLHWRSQEPTPWQPVLLQPMQIQIDPVKAAWPRLLADSMKDINHRTYRHIDQVRGLTEQTQIASREIRSSFGDSEKAIRDLIEEQKATKKELAETKKQLGETIEASAKQAAALEEKLDKMQTILTKLTRRLDAQATESAVFETVRAQLSLAQQEAKLLKQQKVGTSADPGTS